MYVLCYFGVSSNGKLNLYFVPAAWEEGAEKLCEDLAKARLWRSRQAAYQWQSNHPIWAGMVSLQIGDFLSQKSISKLLLSNS